MTKRDIGGNVPPMGDMPDFYYCEENLDGTQDLVDSGLCLFGTELTEWTLFYYVDDTPADLNRDSEETFFKTTALCHGLAAFRVSQPAADGYYLGYATNIRSKTQSLNFDKINKKFGTRLGTSSSSATGRACPLALRRNGDVVLFSVDGVTWNSCVTSIYASTDTLTIGRNQTTGIAGEYRPTVDGVLEVAVWTNSDVDIKSYFDKYL